MALSAFEKEASRALPIFSFSTDGGSIYTPVTELIDGADLGSPATEVVDTTSTDITDGVETVTYGWTKNGPATFVFKNTEVSHAALEALLRQDLDFKVEYTDAEHSLTDSAWTFGGIISAGPSMPMPLRGGLWSTSITIEISGPRTFTVGTSA